MQGISRFNKREMEYTVRTADALLDHSLLEIK